MNRASVSVRNLVKEFDGNRVVNDVNFEVAAGQVLALLGPSGCGKTTILRCLAGLETPDGGTIHIGDTLVNDANRNMHLPSEDRNIGMVFQSYAIWPHMTVFENVAFPLRVRRRPASEIRDGVHEALRLVGLEDLGNRPAPMLSGGQQQRVALARALVSQPQVVLFDEPLSNLDARLRERMRFELAALQQRIGFTAIYVTHDQEEAMALAHQLVLLRSGEIQQVGSPGDVYRNPANPFVADFVGLANALPGEVVGAGPDEGTVQVELAGGLGRVVARCDALPRNGEETLIVFRPEAVQMSKEVMPRLNCFLANVQSALYLGHCFDYGLVAGDQTLRVRGMPEDPPQEGAQVYACVAPNECFAVPNPRG